MEVPKPKRRVDEALLKLIRGQCCVICGSTHVEPCHIGTRGARRPDTHWNVIPMCREHHDEQHWQGWYRMCRRYPPLWFKMEALGWEWNGVKPWHRLLLTS